MAMSRRFLPSGRVELRIFVRLRVAAWPNWIRTGVKRMSPSPFASDLSGFCYGLIIFSFYELWLDCAKKVKLNLLILDPIFYNNPRASIKINRTCISYLKIGASPAPILMLNACKITE
jgi:hypothetical protein